MAIGAGHTWPLTIVCEGHGKRGAGEFHNGVDVIMRVCELAAGPLMTYPRRCLTFLRNPHRGQRVVESAPGVIAAAKTARRRNGRRRTRYDRCKLSTCGAAA